MINYLRAKPLKVYIYNSLLIAAGMFLWLIFTNHVLAHSGKELPRFGAIKTSKVNVRKGPGTKYPIEWVFVSKDEPVEIIAEYGNWYKIRDKSGEGGWSHSSMLNSKRFIVILGDQPKNLFKNYSTRGKLLAKLKPGTRCKLRKCYGNWCKIEHGKYSGWIGRQDIWGISDKD
jgi:SH3-like domain-containing protein